MAPAKSCSRWRAAEFPGTAASSCPTAACSKIPCRVARNLQGNAAHGGSGQEAAQTAVRCLAPSPQDLAAFPDYEDVSKALRAQKDLAAKFYGRQPAIMRNVCKTVDLSHSGNQPLWSPSCRASTSSCDFVALRACNKGADWAYRFRAWEVQLSVTADETWVHEETVYILSIHDGTHMSLSLGCACVVIEWVQLDARVHLLVIDYASSHIHLMDPERGKAIPTGYRPDTVGMYAHGACLLVLVDSIRLERVDVTSGNVTYAISWVGDSRGRLAWSAWSAPPGAPVRNELIIAEWTPKTSQLAGFTCLTTWSPETGPVVISCLRAPMDAPISAEIGRCDLSWGKDGKLLLIARGFDFLALETATWRTLVDSCVNKSAFRGSLAPEGACPSG
ncbi:hypothetical protein WJX84_007108 [Apatococcus fuscideae]|uniref:Uncharacterized protein n=1 Tax=Apatococcus fuscideae TaxID=2026836 RepID=A0AAW1SW87_9CHLO